MPDMGNVIKGLNDIGGFIAGRIGFEQARNFLRTIDDALALLKEQEAKTVIKIAKRFNDCDLTGYCPSCSRPLIKDWAENYCGYCGKPVLWEGR